MKIQNIINYTDSFYQIDFQKFRSLKGSQKAVAVAAAVFAFLLLLGPTTVIAFRAIEIYLHRKKEASKSDETSTSTPTSKEASVPDEFSPSTPPSYEMAHATEKVAKQVFPQDVQQIDQKREPTEDEKAQPFVDGFKKALTKKGVNLEGLPKNPSESIKKLIDLVREHKIRELEFSGINAVLYSKHWAVMPSVTSIKITNPGENLEFSGRFNRSFPHLRKLSISSNKKREVTLPESLAMRITVSESDLVSYKVLNADQKKEKMSDWLQNRQLTAITSLGEFYDPNSKRESNLLSTHLPKYLNFAQVLEFVKKKVDDASGYVADKLALPLINKLAHQFTLSGSLEMIKTRKSTQFEGSYSMNMYGQVVSSTDAYFDSGDSSLELADREDIREALIAGSQNIFYPDMQEQEKEEAVNRCYKAYRSGQPLVFPTGWTGHAINVVIDGEYLVITNRGDKYGPDENMRVFKIDRDQVTPEVIREIIDREALPPKIENRPNLSVDEYRKEYLFFDKLAGDLKAEKNYELIKVSDQKVGNCSYANNKQAYRALLYTQARKQGKTHLKADEFSTKEYKKWSLYDRIQGLKELKLLIDQEGLEAFDRGQLAAMIKSMVKKTRKHLKDGNEKLRLNGEQAIDALLKFYS